MKKQGFISTDEVLAIHANLIRRYGGLSGVRDRGLLESALARPFQSFNGEDLYPSLEQKAAAILESIVKNHPFIDGNKRTGYVLMRLLLNAQPMSNELLKASFFVDLPLRLL